jgi:hypothetical protein
MAEELGGEQPGRWSWRADPQPAIDLPEVTISTSSASGSGVILRPAEIVRPFSFDGYPVHIEIGDNSEPLFVACDVVEAVGATWDGAHTITHIPEQWRGLYPIQPLGECQTMAVLTEQGVYFYLGKRLSRPPMSPQAGMPLRRTDAPMTPPA